MVILWSPIRTDNRYTLEKQGDTLILDGVPYDLSPLEAGGRLPAEAIESDWFTEDIVRTDDGILQIPLLLPHGPDAPESVRFPEPLVNPEDGAIEMP